MPVTILLLSAADLYNAWLPSLYSRLYPDLPIPALLFNP